MPAPNSNQQYRQLLKQNPALKISIRQDVLKSLDTMLQINSVSSHCQKILDDLEKHYLSSKQELKTLHKHLKNMEKILKQLKNVL